MSDTERGTGRTTRQILSAPQGALFVVYNSAHAEHTKRLAAHLSREDLRVVPVSVLEHPERLVGQQLTGVSIDHYCADNLTGKQIAALDYIYPLIRSK